MLRCALLLLCVGLPAGAQIRFTEVAEAAGVQPLQQVLRPRGECHLFEGRHCEPERMTGGVAVGDYDGDGWPDLYFTRLDGRDTLLRNRGDGTFADETAAVGLDGDWMSNGALWVDVENDGDLDLYLTTIAAPGYLLFINEDGRFVEQGLERGAAVASGELRVGFGLAAGDYDRDGFADLFVTEWRITAGDNSPAHTRLLRNRGVAAPGHFEDVTDRLGIVLPRPRGGGTYGFAPAFVDLDGDDWPDLAIAADFGTSRLFWNNGDGTFTDGTAAAAVGTDEHGMGSTFGDFDGDGRVDWFVTSIFDPVGCPDGACNWLGSGNRLYRNRGERRFEDVTDLGVRNGHWGWGAAWLDADHDGDLDLVMTNGVDFPGFDFDEPFNADPMRFWRNDDGEFVEVSAEVGLADTGSGKGLAVLDYDRDGDLDVVIARTGSTPLLYRNDSVSGHSLVVEGVGARSNAQGLGAKVSVRTDRTQVRELGTISHFLGQSEGAAHFGLGAATWAQVTVRWPSGLEQHFPCVTAGRLLVLEPAVGEVFVLPARAAEVCDGLDQDCDGAVDEGLPTVHCGIGQCAQELPGCVGGTPPVCDPLAGAEEEVCDREDNDCDGAVDELDEDDCAVGVGACAATGRWVCALGERRCDATPGDPAVETCDGVDEDCDGEIDEAIAPLPCGRGACAHEVPGCQDGAAGTCDPLRGAAEETCDGADNDCDGTVDEALGAAVCGQGACAHMVARCADGAPVHCDPLRGARPERCDGIDDDCDGSTDEDFPQLGQPCDGPDADECADGVYECAPDGVRCVDLGGASAEVCGGGDEDCDGVIDEGCGDAMVNPDAAPAAPDAAPADAAVPDAAPVEEKAAGGCHAAPGPAWLGWLLCLLATRRGSRAGSRRPRRS